jgi:hypothetical protein
MRSSAFNLCLLAGCLSAATSIASAQTVVHALEGTVKSVNLKAGIIYVNNDDGSASIFKNTTDAKAPATLAKTISTPATSVDKFDGKGNQVILFYTGFDTIRNAVAVSDLGTATLQKTSGKIVSYDKVQRLLTIQNSAGATETFHVDLKTVAETMKGVVDGSKFDPAKGDEIRIVASGTDGDQKTAVFIAPAS